MKYNQIATSPYKAYTLQQKYYAETMVYSSIYLAHIDVSMKYKNSRSQSSKPTLRPGPPPRRHFPQAGQQDPQVPLCIIVISQFSRLEL